VTIDTTYWPQVQVRSPHYRSLTYGPWETIAVVKEISAAIHLRDYYRQVKVPTSRGEQTMDARVLVTTVTEHTGGHEEE